MRVVESVRELQRLAEDERRAGRRIGLVPTMGALHEGHLSLVDEARRKADTVVLSIFVNPTQFGPSEDLSRYPRPRERDLALCAGAGVDVVFAPDPGEMYPAGHQTWITVEDLAKPLCGRSRPTHFRGVATVVAKLFLAARPHVAVFGEKDFQQLALVRRMARDLLFDVEIVGAPIVREADGLARSSRNLNLDPESRREAVVLSRALDAAESALGAGENDAEALLERVRAEISAAPRAEIDYADLCDPETLEPAPHRLEAPALLALAVRFAPPPDAGGPPVRLIDNRLLRPKPVGEERP
jgi:pantoate--beta-alanine ligase